MSKPEKIRISSRVTDGTKRGKVWELRANDRASVTWDSAERNLTPKVSGVKRAHVLLKNLKVLHRFDTAGRDVTNMPGLWSEDDTERPL